jgi:four helix bundle protein
VLVQIKKTRSHEDLRVWQLAMSLAAEVYRNTSMLPVEERYGLQSQMRRAAVSIPSNIAEGAARGSSAEFARFLAISLGSLAELETQLLLCQDLKFLARREELHKSIRTLRVMLSRLRRALLKMQLTFP